jgi:putative ABC transport system permease protein
MLQDLRFGLRMLLKHKGLTIVAVLTLALGIGANAAIFSVVNAVLLNPLPYPNPERVVTIAQTAADAGSVPMSYPNFLDLRAQQTVFAEMSAAVPVGMILTGMGDAERFIGKYATGSFFATLGVQPQLGRLFTTAEDKAGCERVIVLTHGLWQNRFGGDPNVLGRSITMNSEPWTIIGVLRADFDFYGSGGNSFFVPIGRLLDQEYMHRRASRPLLWVTAQLKPGVTIERAQTELNVIAARLEQQYPEANKGKSVTLRSFMDDYVGDNRQVLLVLLAAVTMVLLIACANVANLLLARAAGRGREIALRLALGASRWRIVRQLLTESVLLALTGGALGLLLATWGLELIVKLDPNAMARLDEIKLDGRVLGFTLLISLLTGVIFGSAPAWQTTRMGLQDALKEGGRNSSGGGRRLRQALVVAEIALSLLLLISAGLLLRSFQQMTQVDPGFEPKNVLTMRLRLPDAKYRESAQTLAFLRQVHERVSALPGVQQASFSHGVPLGGRELNEYQLIGQADDAAQGYVALDRTISEGYHATLGIRLVQGRYFTAQDNGTSAPVAIVDEAFVRRHFPNGSALGQQLRFKGDEEPWREIVGVVRNVKHGGLDHAGHIEIYRPFTQTSAHWLADLTRSMDLVVKTATNANSFILPIKKQIQAIDPDQPIANVRTMEEYLARSITPRRFTLTLLGIFAAVALVLSAIGIYGVMSYTVAQRTQEIGIRMALGAQVGDVLTLVLRGGMQWALVGVLFGLIGAFAATRLLRNLLFGVSATDPLTFMGISLLLTLVALLACYLPARRAAQVDPLIALRHE